MGERHAEYPPKEAVYDRDIYPLMGQILDLCKAHGIGVFAHFVLDRVDGKTTYCTSSIRSANGDPKEQIKFQSLEAIALNRFRVAQKGLLHGNS